MNGHLTNSSTVEAERALVGAALSDPASCDLVALHAGQFADPMCALAWGAIVELREERSAIDPVTVADALDERHHAAKAEMPTFLTRCLFSCMTPSNAEYYAALVRKAHTTRVALVALSEVVQRGREGKIEGDEIITEGLAVLARIETEGGDGAMTIGEALAERFAELEEIARARAEGRVVLSGASTGVAKLDELLGGARYGLACIVAGRPGMGKSSLAMGIAFANSVKGGGVHEFSLEDVRATRVDRALARLSKVPSEAMQRSQLNAGQMQEIRAAAADLRGRRGWLVDDRSGVSAEEVVRSVRRHLRANGTRVVIVDYVQLLKRPPHVKSTHEWHGHSMNVLADAAKADNIAYIVLSQLSRDVEKRPDKRPMMSDLRESGTLEERAKQIIALYRGSYYGAPVKGVDFEPPYPPPTDDEFQSRVDLLVLKNQNGQTGRVRAHWDGPTTTIS